MAQDVGYLERKSRKEEVLRHVDNGDWKAAVGEYDKPGEYHEPLLVWIRPSKEALAFLGREVSELGLSGVVSVGCGCGFLEWLLNKSTGISVEGLEVNRGWWESPHSTPHLIPLKYTDPDVVPPLPGDKALLFCYFNNREAFDRYLSVYPGDCVVLVGPVDGRRHCDPEPFDLEGSSNWEVRSWHDIREAGQDVVAVYVRKKKN